MTTKKIKQPILPPHLRSTMPDDVRQQLEAKLLSFAGERAVFFGPEPHAQALLQRGRLFPERAEFRAGRKRQCRANAARLWERATTKNRIATGYALNDGLWIPHSWVVREGVLYETTFPNERYFGVELDDMEAVKFWAENLLFQLYPGQPAPPSFWAKRRRISKLLDEFMEQHRPALTESRQDVQDGAS